MCGIVPSPLRPASLPSTLLEHVGVSSLTATTARSPPCIMHQTENLPTRRKASVSSPVPQAAETVSAAVRRRSCPRARSIHSHYRNIIRAIALSTNCPLLLLGAHPCNTAAAFSTYGARVTLSSTAAIAALHRFRSSPKSRLAACGRAAACLNHQPRRRAVIFRIFVCGLGLGLLPSALWGPPSLSSVPHRIE